MYRADPRLRPDYRRSVLFGGARRRLSRRRTGIAALVAALALSAVLGDNLDEGASASPMSDTPTPAGQAPQTPGDSRQAVLEAAGAGVRWRASKALGLPYSRGRLVRGVQIPEDGPFWFTWDPVLRRSPDRPWRRWGTDELVRTLLTVLHEFDLDHPEAPRVGIGDLSRPRGGFFGRIYGGLGHMSHQNGLDADVYYPRKDGLEEEATRPGQVDRELAQDLVDRFVAAGATKVYVGPALGLRGPRRVVIPLPHHDDHLHVRIPAPE